MWNNTDFSQESKGLNAPMLVVLAEDDPIFNQKVKPFWEKWYPNCEIIMCKNTTHNITDDTPVFIASAIENFVVKHT
jgi:pimeloyl-ACP methyl ester carboxylesterase